MSPLVAGVDCSTQSTRVLVVDPRTGRSRRAARPALVTGSDGARETDPEVWWEALRAACGDRPRGELGAISVAGQQHGLVVTDDGGRPLHPAILWNDTRSAPEARELGEALGGPSEWAARIGLVPVPSFTATRWALRRNEPGAAAAARAVRLPRLPDRAALRPRHDRPRRRIGHSLVVDARRALRRRGPRADRLDRALLPDVLGPAEAAGRGERLDAASSASRPARSSARAQATTWAQRWGWAPRRASRW